MTSDSHLYPGFRFAGALASVEEQRRLQRDVLASLPVRHLLSVGCGYGDELEAMLDRRADLDGALHVAAIDLADVGDEARTRPNVARLKDRFRFSRLGLVEAARIEGFGSFDVVQCGFVLHDIGPEDKERAMAMLARSVPAGGYLLVSDIFLSAGGDAGEIGSIYDSFLAEARDALREGRLSEDQYEGLAGDGDCPGLIRSRRDAMRGTRDHFEEPTKLIDRARQAGLVLLRMLVNPCRGSLLLMLFGRLSLPGTRAPKANGHVL